MSKTDINKDFICVRFHSLMSKGKYYSCINMLHSISMLYKYNIKKSTGIETNIRKQVIKKTKKAPKHCKYVKNEYWQIDQMMNLRFQDVYT